MTEQKENNKRRLIEYGQLNTVKKAVVEILSIEVDFLPRKYLFSCLDSLGIYDDDKQMFTYTTIRPVLAELEDQGFILGSNKGLRVPAPFCFKVVQELVKADGFAKIAHALLQAHPFSLRSCQYKFRSDKEFFRALQIAMYGKKAAVDIDVVYKCGMEAFPLDFRKNPPVLQLLNRPFQPQLLDNMALAVILLHAAKGPTLVLAPLSVGANCPVSYDHHGHPGGKSSG